MRFLTAKDIKLKKRKKTAHKGQAGKVLIIGGSVDYVGAVALAGLAALRSGVDWVTIAAPEKVAWAINALSPDLITRKVKGTHISEKNLKELLKLSEQFDAVLIGNGLGLKPGTKEFVKSFVKKCKKPIVIDADGINAIKLQDIKNAILTPHHAELKGLLDRSKFKQSHTAKNIQKIASTNVILWKGPVDHIISKEYILYNKTGNEGMTVAGTGDILAGLVVGFLAQGYEKFQSACYAAYIAGSVGDLLLKKKGYYSFIASDLIDDIEKVILKLEYGTRKKARKVR